MLSSFLDFYIKNYLSCKNPRNGAKPVPAPIKMIFSHFIASVNEDFLNYARILFGYVLKYFDIKPFSTILAITITFFCLLYADPIVNTLGAIESESSTKSSKPIFTYCS